MLKQRELLIGSWDVPSRKINGVPENITPTFGPFLSVTSEKLSSEGHPFQASHRTRKAYRGKHPKKAKKAFNGSFIGKNADLGGPFQVSKVYGELSKQKIAAHRVYFGVDTVYEYDIGARYGSFYGNSLGIPTPSTNAQLDAFGTRGISKASPLNPLSGMGQFLAELRDTPKAWKPDYWKKAAREFKKMDAKKFADRHLEVSFGWLPLISDIRDFLKVGKNLTNNARQFERDSGRHIRRKRTILESVTNTTAASALGGGTPAMPSYMYQNAGIGSKDVQTFTKVWFSGSFTYYVPPIKNGKFFGDFLHYQSVTNHLFGTQMSPSLLWELAPWSWLIDWKTNTGDIIKNWNDFQNDKLIMHYGYVMETKYIITTYNLKFLEIYGEPEPINLTDRIVQVVKTRRNATPYGFGLNPGSFSGKQLSILGALGIQRFSR